MLPRIDLNSWPQVIPPLHPASVSRITGITGISHDTRQYNYHDIKWYVAFFRCHKKYMTIYKFTYLTTPLLSTKSALVPSIFKVFLESFPPFHFFPRFCLKTKLRVRGHSTLLSYSNLLVTGQEKLQKLYLERNMLHHLISVNQLPDYI